MTIKAVGAGLDDEGMAAILVEGAFEIPVSGRRLAGLFWLMTDEQQAEFFTALCQIAQEEGFQFDMQMLDMFARLAEDARQFVREFGERVSE